MNRAAPRMTQPNAGGRQPTTRNPAPTHSAANPSRPTTAPRMHRAGGPGPSRRRARGSPMKTANPRRATMAPRSGQNAPNSMQHRPAVVNRPPAVNRPHVHQRPPTTNTAPRGHSQPVHQPVHRPTAHPHSGHPHSGHAHHQPAAERIVDRPVGRQVKQTDEYRAAATSSGSGFFGQTQLLDNDPDAPPLPDNAHEIVENARAYFDEILQDENVMAAMTTTQAKGFQTQRDKICDSLTELFASNKMNHFAYSSLVGIFESAQNRQYDAGLRTVKEFSSECRKGKAKFATHRRWVTGFGIILRTAKQCSI